MICLIEFAVSVDKEKQPHQDSNLDLEFRKLLFYPLNYGAIGGKNIIINRINKIRIIFMVI